MQRKKTNVKQNYRYEYLVEILTKTGKWLIKSEVSVSRSFSWLTESGFSSSFQIPLGMFFRI